MQAAKNVICQTNVKHTAKPLYMQKICTDGNGLMMPMKNEIISVNEVMVIDTAASDNIMPIRSGTSNLTDVRLQAANITNVSSMPIPVLRKEKIKWILNRSIDADKINFKISSKW